MYRHQRLRKIILLLIMIVPITIMWGCKTESTPIKLKFETIEQGDFSGISGQSVWPIRNQADWESFWAKHKGTISPVPESPPVDFSNEMVIGVFDGQRPTSGYSVEITSIEETADKIIISVTSTTPGGVTLQVITHPFHLVKTSLSDKPIEVQRTSK